VSTKKRKKSPGWQADQLTETSKAVKSDDSIDHIGERIKHLEDQLKAQAFHQRRIVKNLGIVAPGWDSGLDRTLSAVGLLPRKDFSSGVQARLEKSVGAALADRGVLLLVGHVPKDGKPLNGREWKIMEGEEWNPAMKQERRWRSKYRDSNYNPYDRLDLAMEAQYCRLPPWLANVVRTRMVTDREMAGEMLIELGKVFGNRYGVDVMGLGLHSENANDWHVHILFSRSLEKVTEKQAGRKGRKEKTRLNGIMRERLKKDGKPKTPKAVAAALREAIEAGEFPDPLTADRKIEYVRRQEKKNDAEPRTLGPAYRNKFWVYDAADGVDKNRVGESNDRPVNDPGGFRCWLADLKLAGSSPEEHFSDVWTERQWQTICQRVLDPQELEKVEELRRKSVANYLEIGTSMSTPMETVAAHLRRERRRVEELELLVAAEDQLEPSPEEIEGRERLAQQLEDARAENEKLKKLRASTEKEVENLRAKSKDLQEDVERRTAENSKKETAIGAALQEIPIELKGQTVAETIQKLGQEVVTLRGTVQRILNAAKDGLKPKKIVERVRAILGLKAPEEPEKESVEPS